MIACVRKSAELRTFLARESEHAETKRWKDMQLRTVDVVDSRGRFRLARKTLQDVTQQRSSSAEPKKPQNWECHPWLLFSGDADLFALVFGSAIVFF
jgi:hypothetical protein